jgi:hypothetical protein
MYRWEAIALAVLAAALPVLAGGLHGWLLAALALASGSVAVLALPKKKNRQVSTWKLEMGLDLLIRRCGRMSPSE